MQTSDLEAVRQELPPFLKSSLKFWLIRKRFFLQHSLSASAEAFLQKSTSGTFVTLSLDGRMRGCAGSPSHSRTFLRDFQRNAIRAAFFDKRFEPLKFDEIDRLEFKVDQVLEIRPTFVSSREDFLCELEDRTAGIVVRFGELGTALLPSKLRSFVDPVEAEIYIWTKMGRGRPTDREYSDIAVRRFRTFEWF